MKTIELTTPFTTGDFDTEDYTHAQVRSIELNLESKSLIITASLGYFDGEGDWVPAKFATSETMFRVDIAKADLGTLLGDAIPFVDAVIQRLADDGMCEGTVV